MVSNDFLYIYKYFYIFYFYILRVILFGIFWMLPVFICARFHWIIYIIVHRTHWFEFVTLKHIFKCKAVSFIITTRIIFKILIFTYIFAVMHTTLCELFCLLVSKFMANFDLWRISKIMANFDELCLDILDWNSK